MIIACDNCNNNTGLIRVFRSATWELIGLIPGRQPKLQLDSGLKFTTRIWYVTKYNGIEASVVYLEDKRMLLEQLFV